MSFTRSHCSKPHPTQLWTLPEIRQTQLLWMHHHSHCKNFFHISNLNLPSSSLKLLHLILSLQALVKTVTMSLWAPCIYWKASIRSPWTFLSRLQALLSSLQRCSILLTVFVAILWTWSKRSISFLCCGPHSTPGGVSPEWSRRAESLHSPCCLHCSWWKQARVQLAFWAKSAHWWVTSVFSPISFFTIIIINVLVRRCSSWVVSGRRLVCGSCRCPL